jgi:dTDP-4-dehydrorhamnose 3,5-epimerase
LNEARADIRGVVKTSLAPIADQRGSFMELWRVTSTDGVGATFRQANLSRSEARVLRGMHFHERQADLWIVLEGRASVGLVDLRLMIRGESAAPLTDQFEMVAGSSVLIPRGVAHGFLALERLALLYLVTQEYDGTDEHGFAWDDTAAGLSWPIADPIVSNRDRSNPTLADAVEAAAQRGVLTLDR